MTDAWKVPEIPPNIAWPAGFTTDFVTFFPDRPWLWRWWPPWPVRVDLRKPAWWHDLRFWLGYFVPSDLPHAQIATLKPRPNWERNDGQWVTIDDHFRIDCMAMGMTEGTARAAWRVVRAAGKHHYYWADEEAWARISHNWPETLA